MNDSPQPSCRQLVRLSECPGSFYEKAPLVTVCLITYNHRPFIQEAVESVLMQEVDFPVEVLLHDDCSTDGTSELVREYAARFPGLIKAVVQPRNIYSQKIKPLPILFRRARGQYIVLLEGDDAWRDPQKLAKQVDFLQQHQQCVICFGNAAVIDEKGNVLQERRLNLRNCRCLRSEELIGFQHSMPTATVMFRNLPILQNIPPAINQVLNGDSFLFALLAQFGQAGYVDIIPSLYRQHPGGIYSALDEITRRRESQKTKKYLRKELQKEFHSVIDDSLERSYRQQVMDLRRQRAFMPVVKATWEYLFFVCRYRKLSCWWPSLRFCLSEWRKTILYKGASATDNGAEV